MTGRRRSEWATRRIFIKSVTLTDWRFLGDLKKELKG
jgi:hypothetical protein